LNAARPGSLVPSEIWVLYASPKAAALLQRDPLDRFAVTSHAERLQELRADPLARGTLTLLSITALVALVLALIGLLLTVVTDQRDESGELFDLRAQGVSARELRRYLRVRAALVAIAGVAGGVGTGAILVTLVSSVVAVTAGATTPLPPLVVSLDWPLLALGCAAFALSAGVIVNSSTLRRPA
jgi:ABC-type antimicrobial peptide transport system permease subunit